METLQRELQTKEEKWSIEQRVWLCTSRKRDELCALKLDISRLGPAGTHGRSCCENYLTSDDAYDMHMSSLTQET